MKFISGKDRNQINLLPESIDEYVEENNPVRVIDAYVDSLNMSELEFNKCEPNNTGRPMYSPQTLLKLYIYGYMNKIRSSRCLEKETKRNLEVIWLLGNLSPDHKTISRFRQNNPKALKNVFKDFVKLCDKLELFGKELIAVDGSKFKAWNSKARNFNKDKLTDRIKRIDEKIESYIAELDKKDAEETELHDDNINNVKEIIEDLKKRKDLYTDLQNKLKDSDEMQISLTDPDSRLMKTKNGFDVCHNIQTAVDSKNKMIAEFSVESQVNDQNLMTPIAEKAAELLDVENMTVVADKGYSSASDAAQALKNGYTPVITGMEYEFCMPVDKENAEEITEYNSETARSVYIPERNIFICPMGNPLYPCSYNKKKHIAYYRNTKACKNCKQQCTKSKTYRAERAMKASLFSKDYNDKDLFVQKVIINQNKEIAKKRKSIAEHPFGGIKRNMGVSYLLLKSKEKVGGEISLAFLSYNLKRALNIVGVKGLIEALAG